MFANVLPLSYQSQNLSFSDWVSLSTLCLSPLIIHIVSGVPPRLSYLTSSRPGLLDRICLYNPTSIIWRYIAIADRRIRCRSWGPAERAASNAVFWTSQGWDGSEEMVTASLPFCTRLPENFSIFSTEAIKTLIITLQGTQAVYALFGAVAGRLNPGGNIGLDQVFFPLAVLGLLRLCAAAWLTDDYMYEAKDFTSQTVTVSVSVPLNPMARRNDLVDSQHIHVPPQGPFKPISYWPSRMFRILYLVPCIGIWIICGLIVIPWRTTTSIIYFYTTSTFALGLLYLFGLTVSVLLYAYYFLRGRTTTTIIPCVSSPWYKAYTLLLMAFMVVIMVISSIETRLTVCGKYTSTPGELGDLFMCETAGRWVLPIKTGSEGAFGLASRFANNNATDIVLEEGQIWIDSFTGYCLGEGDIDSVLRVASLGTVNAAPVFTFAGIAATALKGGWEAHLYRVGDEYDFVGHPLN
ncbi:uncharacterized protein BCR38DRAFT_342363 [Pseudomassariella vexata]|uniref:Uncharacterized protein n=1 Tax=Pseudomassariella vexata TaxID=1141098 RepID=A0A1Y2E0B4_9PEZI|nr:uncharacterized protein BCR38DRAFT_342363 [Pseudomassariella vexata]ORY64972.1 hypothetical protein BCR38DRAFT_342363 [Pseudomassariella vexata]